MRPQFSQAGTNLFDGSNSSILYQMTIYFMAAASCQRRTCQRYCVVLYGNKQIETSISQKPPWKNKSGIYLYWATALFLCLATLFQIRDKIGKQGRVVHTLPFCSAKPLVGGKPPIPRTAPCRSWLRVPLERFIGRWPIEWAEHWLC